MFENVAVYLFVEGKKHFNIVSGMEGTAIRMVSQHFYPESKVRLCFTLRTHTDTFNSQAYYIFLGFVEVCLVSKMNSAEQKR